MGSIPTRSRHPAARRRPAAIVVLALVLALTAGTASRALAQDSLPAAPRDSAARDSVVPDSLKADSAKTDSLRADSAAAPPAADTSRARSVSPGSALWRSLLVPGWGQARLGRKLSAGVFIAIEGATLAMAVKTSRELAYLRRTGSGRVEDKVQQREDWLVLLGFNHLLAGLEAYVAAHLSDFPSDLRLRAVPNGVALSLPFRIP